MIVIVYAVMSMKWSGSAHMLILEQLFGPRVSQISKKMQSLLTHFDYTLTIFAYRSAYSSSD